MSCEECNRETTEIRRIAYYRIGNKEIGWGNIGLIECVRHIKLALDKLNTEVGK